MNINNGLVMLVDALPGMNRIRAVQRALEGRVKPVYLEIGVSRGQAFQRISADVKIAVDPAFKLSERTRELADAKGRETHYFETTSDAFLGERDGVPRAAPHRRRIDRRAPHLRAGRARRRENPAAI